MKRYVSATNYYDKKMTTEEVAEELRKKYELYGIYTTKRGKQYHYTINSSGRVYAREQYCEHKSTGGYHIRERYLYKIPMEMQKYITEEYGEQLGELGITLRF